MTLYTLSFSSSSELVVLKPMTRMPALVAALIPANESSKTMHSSGLRFRSSAASK